MVYCSVCRNLRQSTVFFQSFNSHCWLSREICNVHVDFYVEFVEAVRHICLHDFGAGPASEDMVSFLSACPELVRRKYILRFFKICVWVILSRVCPKLNWDLVKLALQRWSCGVSMSIEPLQGFLLYSDSERNFFRDPDSIDGCIASVEGFCDKALQADYNPWSSVTFHEY